MTCDMDIVDCFEHTLKLTNLLPVVTDAVLNDHGLSSDVVVFG